MHVDFPQSVYVRSACFPAALGTEEGLILQGKYEARARSRKPNSRNDITLEHMFISVFVLLEVVGPCFCLMGGVYCPQLRKSGSSVLSLQSSLRHVETKCYRRGLSVTATEEHRSGSAIEPRMYAPVVCVLLMASASARMFLRSESLDW